jgi:hypothetical protein
MTRSNMKPRGRHLVMIVKGAIAQAKAAGMTPEEAAEHAIAVLEESPANTPEAQYEWTEGDILDIVEMAFSDMQVAVATHDQILLGIERCKKIWVLKHGHIDDDLAALFDVLQERGRWDNALKDYCVRHNAPAKPRVIKSQQKLLVKHHDFLFEIFCSGWDAVFDFDDPEKAWNVFKQFIGHESPHDSWRKYTDETFPQPDGSEDPET